MTHDPSSRLPHRQLRPSEPPLRLEQFLPYRLSVLSNQISRALSARYEKRFDLKPMEWRVMAVLATQPGLTATELASVTAMDKVATSRAVTRLLQCGRAHATPDPADGRRSHIFLSPAGLEVYRSVVPMALDVEARLLAGLDSALRDGLEPFLDALGEAARKLDLRRSDRAKADPAND